MNTMTIEHRNKQFIISKTEYKSRFCKKTTEYIEKKGIASDSLFQSTGFKFGCLQNKSDSVEEITAAEFYPHPCPSCRQACIFCRLHRAHNL